MGTGYGPIATEAAWQRPDFIDKFLANQLSRGSVSLVVGAGVSMGFQLPSWDDLVKQMYRTKREKLPTKRRSAPEMCDALKLKYFAGNDLQFSELVRDSMYRKIDADPSLVLSSPLLQAVGSFLVSSMRGRTGSLISFNFDDLIETYLRLLGFVVRSEPKAPYWTVNADMQVLHPHGILPQDPKQPCTDIVLTASDYDRVIGHDSDAWNQSMKSVLAGTTPVFLGLSGDDQRLRSLLTQVKTIHPALVRESHRYWAVRPTVVGEDESIVARWKGLGVAPRTLPSYDGIPSWLLGVCQRSALLAAPPAA